MTGRYKLGRYAQVQEAGQTAPLGSCRKDKTKSTSNSKGDFSALSPALVCILFTNEQSGNFARELKESGIG